MFALVALVPFAPAALGETEANPHGFLPPLDAAHIDTSILYT